ncbi:Uncharacterized protein F383_36560 [Gossypium arboreum]|uniref:Uncharacterized protein n=1 Tax=Gossypium arboreum TaxID=29729 RepID=A0A0B0MAM3_GOSAR|nr:Uncharacterized protein F383_36560 [Gossypium arboreum]
MSLSLLSITIKGDKALNIQVHIKFAWKASNLNILNPFASHIIPHKLVPFAETKPLVSNVE